MELRGRPRPSGLGAILLVVMICRTSLSAVTFSFGTARGVVPGLVTGPLVVLDEQQLEPVVALPCCEPPPVAAAGFDRNADMP